MSEVDEEILPSRESIFNSVVEQARKSPADTLTREEQFVLDDREITLPTPHLSPTQIEMYLRCPKQYEMRYVRGKKSPPGVALIEGSTHHEMLEWNNKHKIAHGEDAKLKDVEGVFFDAWKRKQKEIGDWEGETPDGVEKRARKLIRVYMTDMAKRFKPIASERPIAFKVGPVIVAGIIDWEGHIVSGACSDKKPSEIVDYKVLSRRKPTTELENSIQLSTYTAYHRSRGNRGVKAGFCQFLKKSGTVVYESTKATDARVNWLRFIVLSVADSISRGNFPLTSPTNWCCSKRFCGFYSSCRGRIEGGVRCSQNS